MLVLIRKQGEAIHVGDCVQVVVLGVRGNRVRLGLEASEHLDIRRGELDGNNAHMQELAATTPATSASLAEIMTRPDFDPKIARALASIQDDPTAQWSVSDLARRAHMSRSGFCARFRETFGKPPLQFLAEYRMQKACQLLRETDLAIAEVATQVGYGSLSSFSNAFKRWIGTSPSTFRRNGITSDAHSEGEVSSKH